MPRSVLLLLLLALAGCSAPRLSLVPRAAVLDIEGDFGASEANGVLESDFDALGLDDSRSVFVPRAELDSGPLRLVFTAVSTRFSGRGTTEAEVTIGGVTIDADTEVETDFELDQLSGLVLFDVAPSELVELGIGFGVTYLDLELEMAGEATVRGVTERRSLATDESFPVPVVAARAGLFPGALGAALDLAFFEVSIDDGELAVLEYEAAIEYHLVGGDRRLRLALAAGWRGTEVDARYDDGDSRVEADFRISGPFFGLSLSF